MNDLLFPSGSDEVSGLYARVLLETGIDAPEGLTYAVPPAMADLAVGERVVAPLGRGDRPAEGHVVEIVDSVDFDPARIKVLTKRVGVRTPPGLVRLAQWMAAYYCCPVGMVLGTMVPAAVKKGTGRVRRRYLERALDAEGQPIEPTEKLTPTASKAWEGLLALGDGVFPIEPRALVDRLGLKSIAPVNRLIRAGLLNEVERVTVRAPLFDIPLEEDVRPTLTPDQASAVAAVVRDLGEFRPHLLRGVTGSGKTEVYLHVLEAVLARGGSAVVLVPEISLTPQTAGRFLKRFQRHEDVASDQGATRRMTDLVAVLHSGLTASQRHQQWTRLATGEARIAIGARSAIFAPFPESAPLGLIVVDEEHDSSYKQDQLPRYHARDVALKRGQLEGCPVLLGSATPSLESWHNARRGRFGLIELTQRVGGGVMPRVEVVDLAEERRARPDLVRMRDTLGPRLSVAIGRTLDEGGQVMLLLNRRGYAGYIACASSSCGWFLQCDQCDVALVHHRARLESPDGRQVKFVQCHHCLSRQRLPSLCPVCDRKLMSLGFGTQRLEEELAGKFPQLISGDTMLRLDGDTMRTARDYFHALEAFRRGDVRLLMGTQMIAKGLDFPDVRLIGVVNADTAIHLPDFRAAERTFQLVSQVAGRAGRSASSASARVIVQTMNPMERAIVCAAKHDFVGFAERELEGRQSAGLPPVSRMVRIVCRDEDPEAAFGRSRRIAESLRQLNEAHLDVRGPMACPIGRIAGQTRVSVELLAPSAGPLQRALTTLRNLDVARSDRHTAIDVDPVSLM